jgi:hypothetical protein
MVRVNAPAIRVFLYFAVCAALLAGDKKSPQGQVEDDAVAITATILSADQVREAVGTDFDNNYIVLNVRIAPKGSMPYVVTLDDFILRSEASGDHSAPFLSAGQIAGAGALVVERSYGNRANPDSPRPLEGTKLEMKADEKGNPALDALKKKMLAAKTSTEPVSGLLFFPLNTKEKAKNLILSCRTPHSKLRLAFK